MITLSLIGIVAGIFGQSPEDWMDNITSWRTVIIQFGIIVLTASLAIFLHKRFFCGVEKGNILAFSNRSSSHQQNIFMNELLITKNILGIGMACDEITKQSYTFWESFFIERDGKMRLMFASPDGEQVKIREEMVRGNLVEQEREWPGVIKYNLNILLDNAKKIKNKHSLLDSDMRCEIGIYDFFPVINCVITDNYVFMHHYGSNARGVNMPVYVINKNENEINKDIYIFYKAMLNDYWKNHTEEKVPI